MPLGTLWNLILTLPTAYVLSKKKKIHDYITEHFQGDCLLAVGDEDLIKIHFHTNEPWLVLEYCASLGDIYDVIVENMQRQADGLKG